MIGQLLTNTNKILYCATVAPEFRRRGRQLNGAYIVPDEAQVADGVVAATVDHMRSCFVMIDQ